MNIKNHNDDIQNMLIYMYKCILGGIVMGIVLKKAKKYI